jgi:hypothetical protein
MRRHNTNNQLNMLTIVARISSEFGEKTIIQISRVDAIAGHEELNRESPCILCSNTKLFYN